MSINFTNHHLPEPTGACIKEKIIGIVPEAGIDAYIVAKQQIRDTVGYEGGRHRVSFTPKDADAAKALSEAMLGIQSRKVPVVNVIRQEDIRFDIPAATLKDDAAFVSLEAHPNSTVEVFFQGIDPSESIAFSADVYTVPFLKTVRFDCKMFDLKYNLELRTIDWNITHTDDSVCSLDLFHRFYSLISMASDGRSLRVGIKIEDKIQPFADMSNVGNAENASAFSDPKNLSSYTKRILHHFSITDVPVTRALLNQQRVNLHIFAGALDNALESMTLTIPLLDGFSLEENREYTTIFPINVRLGNYLVCAIVKINGSYAKTGGNYECISNRLTLLHTFLSPQEDATGFCETLDLKLEELAQKEESATTITINRLNRESEKALCLDVEGK